MLLKDDKLKEKYMQNANGLIKTDHSNSSDKDKLQNIYFGIGC